jgi:hypothetical protein
VKDQTSLKSVQNMVVIRGGAVLRDDLLAGLPGLFRFFRGFGHNLPS